MNAWGKKLHADKAAQVKFGTFDHVPFMWPGLIGFCV